jgi:3-oxoacyl-(acyl-carrier-protein) synthase
MTPMAVGTRLASVSPGVIAMVVGKTGPRKKPSSARAAQVSALATARPAWHRR